ncbi:MAG: N-acetyl-gamma-glutamyl-phosphate reductase [Acidimicrobiales bacterium]
MKVGIAGASGYTGAELLRLCARHPELDVAWASGDSQAGAVVGDLYPSLAAAYPGLSYSELDPADADGLDLVFLALPHGASQALVPELSKRVGAIVDLSSDFRLRDPSLYATWYGAEHTASELLATAVYGLPELTRDQLPGAALVACAGCYVTAAALALEPLVRAGAIQTVGVIVDGASGVSGAGAKLARSTQFATVDSDFVAYGLLDHRHTPEMEQVIGAVVLFTPHLAPMTRGILVTCYARPTPGFPDPLEVLAEAWKDEPFVVVSQRSPSTKATLGSNAAHLTARLDARTGWVVVLCALDNLVKGASGQAVQCANVVLGLPEVTGLTDAGLWP